MRLKWAHAKFLEWFMAHSMNSVSTSSIIIPKFISLYSLPLWLPTQIVSQPFWTTHQSLNKLYNFVPLPVICLPRRLSCSIFFPQPLGGPSPGTFPEPLRLGWVPCGKHTPHPLLSPSVHHDGSGCSLGGCSLPGRSSLTLPGRTGSSFPRDLLEPQAHFLCYYAVTVLISLWRWEGLGPPHLLDFRHKCGAQNTMCVPTKDLLNKWIKYLELQRILLM